MIDIKCGYSKCKLGGEVSKEEAIKDGRYYHKECHNKKIKKQEIEKYYLSEVNANEPIRNVRNAIAQFVDKKNFDPDYVLWCLKNKAENLNSIYGLSYSLSFKKNEDEFKKLQARKVKIEFSEYENKEFVLDDKLENKEKKGLRWSNAWLN